MMFRSRRRGFTLIELLISVVIGLLAIAAVGNVFMFTSRSYKQDDKISRTQDNLRFAMAQIAADIEMAGFFAQVNNPQNDVLVSTAAKAAYTATTCTSAWVFEDLGALDTIGNATAAQIEAKFPCVTGAKSGTDVLAVKRVLGACVTPVAGTFYLRTNGYENVINYGATGSPTGSVCPVTPTGTTVDVYQFYPVIWYVATDQGVPSLCREILTGAGMQKDPGGCVAQGIEDLQLEFGMDTTGAAGTPDGVADFFQSFDTTPPTAAERSRMVAVRVHLLARSAERDPNYKNPKSYTVGNVAHPVQNDGYYRKTLSSVVLVRNTANRVSPYALPE